MNRLKTIHLENGETAEVDFLIAPAVQLLNTKGYKTIMSCSGHWDKYGDMTRPFIVFEKDYKLDFFKSKLKMSEKRWCFETKIPSTKTAVINFNKKLLDYVKKLPSVPQP